MVCDSKEVRKCPNGTVASKIVALFNKLSTANPTWGDIFESSKLKARTSLLPRFSEKRRSLKQHSKLSPQVDRGSSWIVKLSFLGKLSNV